MAKARTEEQKILSIPIVVEFGGKKYEVKPLVIRDSRKWRADLTKALTSLPVYANVTSDKPDEFRDALHAMLVTMPDTVIDLFFEYARDLNREEVETVATDNEMAKAFEQVVQLAFPLARTLVGAMGNLSQ